MATQKTATKKSDKSAKTTQTSKSTNTKPTSASKPTSAKASTKPSANKSAKNSTKPAKTQTTSTKSNSKPKKNLLAWIVGGAIALAVIIVAVVCIVNAVNNDESKLSIKTGTGDEITTEYVSFDDSSFRLKIPTSFHTLSTDEIKKKYTGEVPQTVYANEANDVNIAISPSDSALSNDQIKTYLDTMKSIFTMGGEVLSDNFITKDNHNIGHIEIVTEDDDNKYYNHMMFFSQDGTLTIVTFNCNDSDRNKWQPVGNFILDSVKFEK